MSTQSQCCPHSTECEESNHATIRSWPIKTNRVKRLMTTVERSGKPRNASPFKKLDTLMSAPTRRQLGMN